MLGTEFRSSCIAVGSISSIIPDYIGSIYGNGSYMEGIARRWRNAREGARGSEGKYKRNIQNKTIKKKSHPVSSVALYFWLLADFRQV